MDAIVDMVVKEAPFIKGTGSWSGVVMIERPDASRAPQDAILVARVISARLVHLNGKRAISCFVPYETVAAYFRSDDGDHIFCEAELKGECLQIWGKSRSTLADWPKYSFNEELLAAANQELLKG